MHALFEIADAFVFPYREIEASGVFYLVQGLARWVIASRLGAFAEAIEDGVSGRLVAPGDPRSWRGRLAECVERRPQPVGAAPRHRLGDDRAGDDRDIRRGLRRLVRLAKAAARGEPVIHSRELPRAEFRPINLRRVIQPFVGRWPALLAATLLPVIAIWTASGYLPPSYRATAQILLEQDQVQLGKIADVMKAPVLPDSATISNEIAIIFSTPVLQGAARRLGMLDADGRPARSADLMAPRLPWPPVQELSPVRSASSAPDRPPRRSTRRRSACKGPRGSPTPCAPA